MSPGRGEQAWRQAAPVRAASAVARGMVGSRGGHPGTAGSGPNRNRREATRGGGGPSWDRGHCALRLEADGAPQEGARGPGRPLHRARLSPGGSQAGPREHAVWAAMPSGASLGGLTQGGLGRTRRVTRPQAHAAPCPVRRHLPPCRSSRSQGSTGASPSGPGGPRTAPAGAPCWTGA